MSCRVFITRKIDPSGVDYLKSRGYDVYFASVPIPDEDTIAREAADCDGMLVRNDRITRKIMDACPRLRVIGRHGVGVDTIDLNCAKEKGIRVTNTPLANYNAVAEHTIHMILSLARHARETEQAFYGGDFDVRSRITNTELAGKALAVIGCGRIGRSVAKKAALGLDMNVTVYDPDIAPGDKGEGITAAGTAQDAVRGADFVTLHLPLTDATRGMVDGAFIAGMKDGAYLINAARGGIVDGGAAAEALRSGKLAGAAFDVLEDEPPRRDDPLFAFPNVILTPHNAAHTAEAFRKMSLHAAMGIDEVLSGKPVSWEVII